MWIDHYDAYEFKYAADRERYEYLLIMKSKSKFLLKLQLSRDREFREAWCGAFQDSS